LERGRRVEEEILRQAQGDRNVMVSLSNPWREGYVEM
jgi:hypothetical protein